jgi:hypothetical protein
MEGSRAWGWVVSLRALVAAAALSTALAAALHQGLAGERSSVAPAAHAGGLFHEGLAGLPLTARGPVSVALGADDPAYRLDASNGGFAATNPAQHLRVRFGRSGVSLSSGATRVGLSLRALGYGASLRGVGAVAPRAKADRVVYAHAGVSEWYANGPLGLEQGFTIPTAPSGHSRGALTLSMALSGNARPSLAVGGESITLGSTGGPVLSYDGVSATDARGRALHTWLELSAGLLLLRVDARDARYPLRIDPFVQQGRKLAGGGESGLAAVFGVSVALSADGSTALIGGPGNRGGGAAWVFTRSGSTWTQQGEKLTGAGESGNGEFGDSVALSADGNIALIGGRGDDGYAGAAWVFTRSGSSWTQQGEKLTGSGESGNSEFGVSVSLSSEGTTALIGGPGDNGDHGAAWVFTRSGSTWTQQGEKLTPVGECGIAYFAKSVALSSDGNMALIGAPVDCDVGAAWVFTRSGSTWAQQGTKLTGTGERGKGWFAESVALSSDGNTALIGGFEDSHGVGAAWVFTRSGSTWSQQGEKLTGSGESGEGEFGISVALSSEGNTALIGGRGDGGYVGAAWVFARSGSTWSQQGDKLTGSGESGYGKGGGYFGDSVALSSDGNTALVGGGRDNELVGAAWVFASQATSPPNPAEYGRCTRVSRASGERVPGQYAKASCTTRGGRSRYEWHRGVARTRFTSKITEGAATFETVKGFAVTCSTETGTGEYTGTSLTTVGDVVLTFTGCERLGQKCSTALAAQGEIVTEPLEGVLGITELGKSALKNKIGLDLYPGGMTGFAMQFSCGTAQVSVRGSLIVPVPANRMLLRLKLKYSAKKGRQKPESFVGEPKDVLEASLDGGSFEQAGLTLETTQTNEERVEVNSAFF